MFSGDVKTKTLFPLTDAKTNAANLDESRIQAIKNELHVLKVALKSMKHCGVWIDSSVKYMMFLTLNLV